MAWIRRSSILKEDNPTLEWDARSKEWLGKVRKQLQEPLEKLPTEHPSYSSQFASPSGIAYPATPDFPLVAKVVHADGPLPDHAPSAGVSSRVKAIVEQLEPSAHQFFPMKVILSDGEIDDTRWLMTVCNRVDALSLEHCVDLHEYRPRPEQHPDWYYYRSNQDNKMKLAVYKDRVAGMATWYDWRFQNFFFSEQLGQNFIDSGIRGYCLPADELNHSSHVVEV